MNKHLKKDEFSDILNSHGFKPSTEAGPTTINSLRNQADAEDDPVKAKVCKTEDSIYSNNNLLPFFAYHIKSLWQD